MENIQAEIESLKADFSSAAASGTAHTIKRLFGRADSLMADIDLHYPGGGDELRDSLAAVLDEAGDEINLRHWRSERRR